MKEIPLTQGQMALVDDDDYEWLSKRKWHARWSRGTKSYYAYTNTYKNGKQTKHIMSRVIMNTVHFLECDHRNHDTLDHRRKNLQNVTPRQNQENRRDQSKHGVGVRKEKRLIGLEKPYYARARLNGKFHHLGCFATAEEAQAARQKFLEEHG